MTTRGRRRSHGFRYEFAGSPPLTATKRRPTRLAIALISFAILLTASFAFDYPSGATATGARFVGAMLLGFAAFAAVVIGATPVSRRRGPGMNEYILADGFLTLGSDAGHDSGGGSDCDGGDGGSD